MRSDELWQEALRLLPGGVNSPVRSFGAVGGRPLFMRRGEGCYLFDEDGNRYIDYVLAWGPLILGHAHPAVVEALCRTAAEGTVLGTPTALENELAALVLDAYPSCDLVRFVNSGTEATMTALRLARAFTGRQKIVKFSGNYHGHHDSLLVQAGSGSLDLGLPSSPGVPAAATALTLTARYNDLEGVAALLVSEEVACVIVEPVAGNMGLVLPEPGFLEGLREVTEATGTLLIFDEVMTGFRVAYGGAQGAFGITPDLTTLGKVLGGGLPVGAVGGRREILELLAPAGPVYQAGTLSGNPLAMAAGIATLNELQRPGTYEALAAVREQLVAGLNEALAEAGWRPSAKGIGAMWGFFFSDEAVTDYEGAQRANGEAYGRFFHGLLAEGVYLAPSQYEAGFLSTAHTPAMIDETLRAMRTVLKQMPKGAFA